MNDLEQCFPVVQFMMALALQLVDYILKWSNKCKLPRELPCGTYVMMYKVILKPGFHMIVAIIWRPLSSDRVDVCMWSDGNHSLGMVAIEATTIVEID